MPIQFCGIEVESWSSRLQEEAFEKSKKLLENSMALGTLCVL